MNKSEVKIIKWLNLCCVFIFIMILVGGITRLTQSGLSMVDWRPIMGIIPPTNQLEWEESFNKYKIYPEYQKINQFKLMTLMDYKTIFYWEYLHRILGRIIGLLTLIPFLIFWIKGDIDKKFFYRILLIPLLVILQGLLGWYMVKSGLVNQPNVSHFRLGAHLLLAFFLFGYIYWIQLCLKNRFKLVRKFSINVLCSHINCLFFLYIAQILYGAFVAGTKSGHLWNTFPLMEGQLIPNGLFSLNPLHLNFFNNMKMIQFIHRVLGTFLMFYSMFFYFKSRNETYSYYTRFLFIALLIQFYIGITTLLLRVPIFMAITHQIIAVIILFILIKIKFLIVSRKPINI